MNKVLMIYEEFYMVYILLFPTNIMVIFTQNLDSRLISLKLSQLTTWRSSPKQQSMALTRGNAHRILTMSTMSRHAKQYKYRVAH